MALTLIRTVVPAVLVIATATGCSSSAPEPMTPSAVQASGSGAAVAGDIAAVCADIVKQGMTQEDAEALAAASGFTTRVGSIDGTPQPTTKDYREDRMTFDVVKGVVTGCIVG